MTLEPSPETAQHSHMQSGRPVCVVHVAPPSFELRMLVEASVAARTTPLSDMDTQVQRPVPAPDLVQYAPPSEDNQIGSIIYPHAASFVPSAEEEMAYQYVGVIDVRSVQLSPR